MIRAAQKDDDPVLAPTKRIRGWGTVEAVEILY
jgi:hypothetical protein